MSDYGNAPPPPPPPPSGSGAYGAQQGYGAPQGYNAPPPPADGMMSQASGELASWGMRVGGYLIDILLLVPGYILYFIGAPKGTTTTASGTVTTTGGNILFVLLGAAYIIAVSVWNRWIKGGRTGQTVGRGVVGVKVVDQNSGQPIGAGKAFLRDLAHILDSIVCGLPIGWLWPLWDKKRQTWGDKIVGTVAVVVPK